MSTTTKKKPVKKAAPRKTAARKPVESVPYSDSIIEEAKAKLTGAPALKEFHQLDRRTRAELSIKIRDLLPRLESLQAKSEKLAKAGVSTESFAEQMTSSLDDTAELMLMLADLEDLLIVIAIDATVMKQWAAEADELELLALFARFTDGMSPRGEASSSSI